MGGYFVIARRYDWTNAFVFVGGDARRFFSRRYCRDVFAVVERRRVFESSRRRRRVGVANAFRGFRG